MLAGLCAKGTTVVDAINHIDRGYDGLDEVLNSMGANIKELNDLRFSQ